MLALRVVTARVLVVLSGSCTSQIETILRQCDCHSRCPVYLAHRERDMSQSQWIFIKKKDQVTCDV